MANGTIIKPTLDEPTSDHAIEYQDDFDKTMKTNQIQLTEVDTLLTEREQSLKKKIWDLAKMESLVHADPKLSAIYDEMAENGEEKYGYHYNETIMNMIFNDYVLNSPKYLEKYKQAIPKEKKRRDKSGINALRKAGEEIEKKREVMKKERQKKQPVSEGSNSISGGGAFESPIGYSDDVKNISKEIDTDKEFEELDKLDVVLPGKERRAYGKYTKPDGSDVSSAIARPAVNKAVKKPFYPGGKITAPTLNGLDVKKQKESKKSELHENIDENEVVDETTGSASSGQFSGPAIWGDGDLMKGGKKKKKDKKPYYKGGVMIQESNYITDPKAFGEYYEELDEMEDFLNPKIMKEDHAQSISQMVSYIISKEGNKMQKIIDMLDDEGIEDLYLDIEAKHGVEQPEEIDEKAKSKSQQQLMGMAYAYKKGELDGEASDEIKKIAAGMSEKDLDDFASTKHKGLPDHVNEENGGLSTERRIEMMKRIQDVSFHGNSGIPPMDYLNTLSDEELTKKFDAALKQDPAVKNKISSMLGLNELEAFDATQWQEKQSGQADIDAEYDRKEQEKDESMDWFVLYAPSEDTFYLAREDEMNDPVVQKMQKYKGPTDVRTANQEYEEIMAGRAGERQEKDMGYFDHLDEDHANTREEKINYIINSDRTKGLFNDDNKKAELGAELTNMSDAMIDVIYTGIEQHSAQQRNESMVDNQEDSMKMKPAEGGGDFPSGMQAGGPMNEDHLQTREEKEKFIAMANMKLGYDDHETMGFEGDMHNMSDEAIDREYRGLENKLREKGIDPTTLEISFDADAMLYETLNKFNHDLNVIERYSKKLKIMNEEKRNSSLVNVDRQGKENAKNFKDDLSHSGTKEIIDVSKELMWADEQTDVPKDPQKLGKDIEKQHLKNTDKGTALKNVGNSANNKGDEITKRNLTDEETSEVDLMRKGLGDFVYDNEPDERYMERMKRDMGEKEFKKREDRLEFQADAPMYNKDTQPVEDGIEKVQFDKEKSGWNERMGIKESSMTGKYVDELGKTRIFDFSTLNVQEVKDGKKGAFFNVEVGGLGNSYDSKVNINEGISDMMNEWTFYTDGKKNVFAEKKNVSKKLNESEHKAVKSPVNEQFEKMKHLLGYDPSKGVNTKNNKL